MDDILAILNSAAIKNYIAWWLTLPLFAIVIIIGSILSWDGFVDLAIYGFGISTGWVLGLGGAYIVVKYHKNEKDKIEL